MNWGSLADFTQMGGQALYVWGAYLMAAVALAWEVLLLNQQRRSALEEARETLPLSGDECT
jgi:heme exporter protein CcmD